MSQAVVTGQTGVSKDKELTIKFHGLWSFGQGVEIDVFNMNEENE